MTSERRSGRAFSSPSASARSLLSAGRRPRYAPARARGERGRQFRAECEASVAAALDGLTSQ